MPYIKRNDNSEITGCFVQPQEENQEFIADGDAELELFKNPPIIWDDVKNLQSAMLGPDAEVMWRIMRYKTQSGLTGKTPDESASKYQKLLQYCQDVRDSDADTYRTPQEAIDALNTLTIPEEV